MCRNPICIQNHAFNLRAAEVYADAKHVFKSSTNLNKMKNKKADGLSAPPPP